MKQWLRIPMDDVLGAMEPIMRVRSPLRSLAPMLVAMAITWFVYVPIHELLHAYGCMVTGGAVTELEIKPMYGGNLLARYFDFVTPGGPYAGRLSGFDTYGNDLIYLATDFAPFLLTVLFGVPLLRWCTRARRPWVFGAAVVVGLAPFYNLPGDYFEMSSILVTRTMTVMAGGNWVGPASYQGIRSDDVFTLLENLITQPGELGLVGAGAVAVGSTLVVICVALSVVLAFATYWAGAVVARVFVGKSRRISFAPPPN